MNFLDSIRPTGWRSTRPARWWSTGRSWPIRRRCARAAGGRTARPAARSRTGRPSSTAATHPSVFSVACVARVLELIEGRRRVLFVLGLGGPVQLGGRLRERLGQRLPRLLGPPGRVVLTELGGRLRILLRVPLDGLPGDRARGELVADDSRQRLRPPGQLDHDPLDPRRPRPFTTGRPSLDGFATPFVVASVTAAEQRDRGQANRKSQPSSKPSRHFTYPRYRSE